MSLMVSAHIEAPRACIPLRDFSFPSLLPGTSVPGFQVPPLGGRIRGKFNIVLASKIRVDR
jgi:hypothetical protein